MSVLLPAPLPPTSPTTSPARKSTVTSSTACTPPNDTRIWRNSTHGRRDHIQFVLYAEIGDGAIQSGRLNRGADGAQGAHQDVREQDGAAHVDAAQLGRVRIATNRKDVPPEASARGDIGHDQRHAN